MNDDIKERMVQLVRLADKLFPEEEYHFMIVVGTGRKTEVAGCCRESQKLMIEALSSTSPVTMENIPAGQVRGN